MLHKRRTLQSGPEQAERTQPRAHLLLPCLSPKAALRLAYKGKKISENGMSRSSVAAVPWYMPVIPSPRTTYTQSKS
jgi:hypothetical protein